ncbi:uncharacterized protein METZ01_LOCUS439060 [marine metagenome]|uniref:Uncharacterized protein n=1 Tax=marine metagenome TaxID=408172 RepID=A0A382YSE6_9ZZZZ
MFSGRVADAAGDRLDVEVAPAPRAQFVTEHASGTERWVAGEESDRGQSFERAQQPGHRGQYPEVGAVGISAAIRPVRFVQAAERAL